MKTVGTFIEADWLLKTGPDAVLAALKERLGLNLVIFFYPKPLWWSQVAGDAPPDDVGGDVALLREGIARARANGIQSWLYLGTFGERHSRLLPEFNVVTIDGEPLRPEGSIRDGWSASYSFCPNNPTLRERYAAVFQEAARSYEIDGFFIGHNRFAPPGNDVGNLFACACRHCVQAAGELGYDFAAMKAALVALRDRLSPLDARVVQGLPVQTGFFDFLRLLGLTPALGDWLNFRCDLIARTMSGFRAAVKEVRPEVIVGQDSIPPSFALLSGHDYRKLEGVQDYLCPNVAHPGLFVIYSLAATARWLGARSPGLAEADALRLTYRFFGYDAFGLPDTVEGLVGELPEVPGPKDTDRSPIPFDRIVPAELRKAGAWATGKVPLYTYLACGKADLTPAGARARVAAAKDAGFDGCILGANWSLGLDRLGEQLDAVSPLLKG